MGVTTYLWNDITDTVVMEKDGAGTTTAVYQSDPVPFGRLRSMRRGGTTYNYHYDGRGNTTYLTDQTGRKTDAYTYDAFGTQRTTAGSTENPYRFGGQHGYQYNPATDDYYVRARVYEPTRGRWRSKDPLEFLDGLNPYIYVENRPSGSIDPTGLASFTVDSAKGRRNVDPCGGYTYHLKYSTTKKVKVNYVVIQRLCAFDGAVTDCAFPARGIQCIFHCAEANAAKKCNPCCYLEIIGGGTVPKTGFGSATDQHTVPHYSLEGCTSKGSWKLTATVHFMMLDRPLALNLKKMYDNLTKKKMPTCDAGCFTPKGVTIGPYLELKGGKPPAWWTKKANIIDSVSVTSSSTWNCCGRFNWQTVTSPNGNSWNARLWENIVEIKTAHPDLAYVGGR